jgi:hypothetical protein
MINGPLHLAARGFHNYYRSQLIKSSMSDGLTTLIIILLINLHPDDPLAVQSLLQNVP